MKKFFGLCAILALITSGVVFSDEVKSIVEQNADPDAVQAVESAVDDSNAMPIQEALPEDSGVPAVAPSEAVEEATEEAIEEAQPESDQLTPAINTPFILGVITSPVPPMVRAQVNLEENTGLFVQTIKPNGPAAKAGVQPYDIIIAIDGAAITNVSDLSSRIQSAAGKPQKLTVLRRGKELTLDVTAQPADAPRQPHGFLFGNQAPHSQQLFIDPMAPNYDPDEDDGNLDPAFPRLQQFMDRQRLQMDNMRQRMEAMENALRQGMPGFVPFAPGMVPAPAPAPNGVLTPAPAPNGMVLPPPQMNDPNAPVQRDSFSVQVHKSGNEPAIIKIQENGNEYIVDENSIDQLPENVRNRLNFKIQTSDK